MKASRRPFPSEPMRPLPRFPKGGLMKNILEILAGPASFAFTAFALTGTFTPAQSFAIGTAVWMALWWILRPVSIYVTAFIPILVDSFFDLIPEGHVLSQYFSEIAVLLLGSDLICLTWTTTGLDRRISVKTLCCICLLYTSPSPRD